LSASYPDLARKHKMPNALIVGATRGLGFELTKRYLEKGYSVTGTARSKVPENAPEAVNWITGVDVSEEDAGNHIVHGLKDNSPDVVVINAGFFVKESLEEPDFEAEVNMYKTSAIGPVFVVRALYKAGLLKKGSKIILVSSEAGSITLRHASEGGGLYGHHASKAAVNMVGKLLSLDLKEHGVAVALVHPGFMRSELTKSVGFDQFWDDGGAVEPSEGAKSLADWIDTFDIEHTGEFWAPRGPSDIGTADKVLGPKDKLSTPLQLPW